VAYVRTLGRVQQSKSTGDSKRGEQIYAGKGGCVQCHTLAGRGGGIGPDLSDVGARLDNGKIRSALLTPEASIPRNFMQVRLVTREGQRLVGVRLNEDTFSIQIRDLSNQVHSFWKTSNEPCRSERNEFAGINASSDCDCSGVHRDQRSVAIIFREMNSATRDSAAQPRPTFSGLGVSLQLLQRRYSFLVSPGGAPASSCANLQRLHQPLIT
jgi:putative heme-binding domain-containing protein